MSFILKIFLVGVLFCCSTKGAIVPEVPCPDIFEYVFVKDHFQGKITLPQLTSNTINLEVEFSQQTSLKNGASGHIALNESEVEIINGKPVVYQIEFPSRSEVPKLLKINVNNEIICGGFQHYSYSSQKFKINHNFSFNIPESSTKNNKQKPSFTSRGSDLEGYQNAFVKPFESEKSGPTVIVITGSEENEKILDLLKAAKRPSSVEPRSLSPEVDSGRFQDLISSTESFPKLIPSTVGHKEICGRVSAGGPSKKGEYPWIVAIYQKMQAKVEFLCGGFLLSSFSIVTTASCIENNMKFNADRLLVYLGSSNLDDYNEQGYQVKDVRTYIIHPEYTTLNRSDANLVLLILETPVSFTDFIIPICMWHHSVNFKYPKNGQDAFIFGWGSLDKNSAKATVPLKTPTKLFNSQQCSELSGLKPIVNSRNLCSKSLNVTESCLNDSVVGLSENLGSRWILRGITSVGSKTEKACLSNNFLVYTDLSKHLDWIKRNMLE